MIHQILRRRSGQEHAVRPGVEQTLVEILRAHADRLAATHVDNFDRDAWLIECDAVARSKDHHVGVQRRRGAAEQRRKHEPVRVGNVVAVRFRSSGDEFVPGDHQLDARLANDTHLAHASGAEKTKILRAEDTAGLEEDGSARDVFARLADVFARRDGSDREDCRRLDFGPFGRQHRVAPRRHWRPRHDPHGFARSDGAFERTSRKGLSGDRR